MMLDQIIRLLGESEADAWEVTETRTEGWDLYFIRHDLDQNRIRNTVHTTVRVFRCSGDRSMIGSASEELPPTASEEEARELIRLLCERASYVRNPYYELCGPSGDSRTGSEGSDGKQPETGEIAAQFLDVFRSVRETEDTFLNSYEIFVDMKTVRFLNSNGVDVTDTRPQSMLEVVSGKNWPGPWKRRFASGATASAPSLCRSSGLYLLFFRHPRSGRSAAFSSTG